jgi:hypothetical protein
VYPETLFDPLLATYTNLSEGDTRIATGLASAAKGEVDNGVRAPVVPTLNPETSSDLARGLLREAVAADPTYPMSHAALASAWSALGYDSKAKAEAQAAFNLSTTLSREERLLVEGNYHEVTKNWAGAGENGVHPWTETQS